MNNPPSFTNADANIQGQLFPSASPLPGRNPAADESAERELLAQACSFARTLIARKQGSANEFVEAFVAEFGTGVKILLIGLVNLLSSRRANPVAVTCPEELIK